MNHSTQPTSTTPQPESLVSRDRQIIDALPTGALLTRVGDGAILFANRAIGKLLGIEDVSAVVGTPVPNLYWDPEERQTVLGRFRAEGSLADYEMRARRVDGSMLWVSISIQWFDFQGEKVLLSTISDITAKKNAEQQFLESEKRLHTLFDALPLPVIVTQISDGKVLYANPRTSELIGLPLENIIGNQTPDFYHNPADRLRFVQFLQKEGRVRNAEIQIKRQDGSLVWVEITVELTVYGGLPATVAVIEDISERKRVEAIEREAERKYRQLYLSIRDGVASIDMDGNIQECNAAFEEMVGYTLDELKQIKFTDLTPEKWHFMEFKILEEQVMTRGYSDLYQKEYIHRDGHIFPIELAVYLTHDAAGRPSGFWGFIRDITERKRAEQSLRESQMLASESQRQLSTLLGNLPGMAYRMANEVSWPATFISQGAYSLTGYQSEELMRGDKYLLDFGDLILEEDRQAVWDQVQKGIDSRQPYQITYRIRTAHHEIRWVWERGQGVFDEKGNLLSLEGFISDITERVYLEEQAHTALERRGRQVQISTQVSQDIASATDLPSLYERVVVQVKERFGYYHVQILRFDPALDAVALVTGYGEVGAKMLAAGHKLPMGVGLIGSAAAVGHTVLRPDLAAGDPDWKPNPLLPATKGEIAVPILWQEKILGVLDVQSAEAGALGADDQLLLEGLCGQIAIAIEQTRLREEMQERLAEINALYRSMSHEGWKTFSQIGDLPDGFLFEQGTVRPAASPVAPSGQTFISAPLTVPGGVTVGLLSIEDDPERPLAPEDEAFLQQISEQVALALESARLFAQTQHTLAETEDLYQASAELNTAKAYNDVLEAMRLNTLLGKNSQNLSLNLFDRPWTPQEEPAWIEVLARWSLLPTGTVMDRYPLAAFPSARTLLHPDVPTLVEDVENDPALDANARALYAQRFGAKSTAFVPLVVSGLWIGYMNAIYQQRTAFPESDVRRLMALAAQAAVVVNNQRLLEETRSRVRREQILRQVTTQVRASVDADTILRTAVRELGGALGRETFIQLGNAAGQPPASAAPNSPQPVDAEGGK